MQDILEAQSPILADLLSPELLKQLLQTGELVRYQDQQIIHHRGDAKPGLSVVRSGLVQVGNFGRDGSYITTSTLGPGQCFGEFTLFAGLPRTHSITALGECEIDQIPGQAFMQLFNREPAVAKALLTISLLRTHSLLEFMDDLRRLPLAVRIAKILMQNIPAQASTVAVKQEDLAYAFGVSRVSMGKILQQLESQQLIRRGYGKITLLDRQRLVNWVRARSPVDPIRPESG